jgi:hypothetical protein
MLIIVINQVIGGHLRHPRGRRAGRNRFAEARIPGDHIARFDKRVIARVTVFHARAADAGERVDVELIVGKDHEVLEMLRIGSGIMIEPVQGIIDARGVKQSQWRRRARIGGVQAIRYRIVHGAKIGGIENIAQRPLGCGRLTRGRAGCAVDVAPVGEVNRDRLIRLADFDRHAVVLDQKTNLLGEVGTKEIGACDRGLVDAGPGDKAVGQARVDACMRLRTNAHERVAGADAAADRLTAPKGLEPLAQKGGVAHINLFKPLHRAGGVRECLGRNRGWRDNFF